MELETAQAVLMVLESVFPTAGGGGSESQVRTLGLEFLRRGQALKVVVPMVASGPQLERELVDGIPVIRIPYPKVPLFGALWMLVSLAWLLIERRHSYSMIHAHIAGNMAAVSSIVGWLLGKPVLVKLAGGTEMQGGILDPMPRPGVRIRKALMRHASAYQATSLRIASLLADRGFRGDKVLHIPNAVNMARFAAVARDHELRRQLCGERARVGVFVGRLESEKGIELMIQGWARVFAERSDAALMLVGDGSLREALQRSVQSLGIASQVVFVGPATQVERYLALADFGVLTSQYEGLSNALLEYMAAGLPVVGSEVSGTEDWVINGRTGWLFPPGSLEDLVRVLAEVADTPFDELRRLGHEAQTLVDAKASIPAMVDALQRTYRELEQARA